MEGMYVDWPDYIPFDDNYPPFSCRRPMPSPHRVRSVPKPPAKQVVSIPVNFIGSRSDYAVKIQKAFRGFRIRKNVSKILELKRGVDEVERDLMEGETVELIIRDDRYRLKVSETLMALLLKLDSIRGLNDAVRVCRKAVIRKAILLQERIDSIFEQDKSESQLDEKSKDNESEAWECVDDGKVEDVGWLVVEEDNNRRLMEKMAEDNRRLMEMIAELCNKKDNQTRLIQSLSNRVEQLEQAMNDRMTRIRDKKKKKQMMLNTFSY